MLPYSMGQRIFQFSSRFVNQTTICDPLRSMSVRLFLTNSSTSADQTTKILITGGLGQLGSGLSSVLRRVYGRERVILSDIRIPSVGLASQGPFVYCDVLDKKALQALVVNERITGIVHFSAMLSAIGEKNVPMAIELNIEGFHNILEVARAQNIQLFVPSTIGAFGPDSPRNPTPDFTVQRPRTIYGVAKVHAELMGEYYHHRYGMDFRCLRLPGVISSNTKPGGGTTDYAVAIFHEAITRGSYTCYLRPTTRLPMLFIDDCIRAIVEFIRTPAHNLNGRTYNISGMSFTPEELAEQIRKTLPNFQITYDVDAEVQSIADSWPEVFDDSRARNDWGWKPQYDTKALCLTMLNDIASSLGTETHEIHHLQ